MTKEKRQQLFGVGNHGNTIPYFEWDSVGFQDKGEENDC